MKKALLFGAGKIGRGFIGRIFYESGYQTCFLDIIPELVDAINDRRRYTVRVISGASKKDAEVKNIRALNAYSGQVAGEIAGCDIIATAVGARNLPDVAAVVAAGVKERMKTGGAPVDVILAENQIGADTLMRGYVYQHLNRQEQAWADKNLGLVASVIGLMVPQPEPGQTDRLLISVEEYNALPVDKSAFKAEIPALKGLLPYAPFSYHVERKLFIHNMGHAVCAYMGHLYGYGYIHEAIADSRVRNTVKSAMLESARALSAEYGVDSAELEKHIGQLLHRFLNAELKDSVIRVGADPPRKLSRGDRLTGAALLCRKHGIEPLNITKGMAAALKFNPSGDARAGELQTAIEQQGLDYVFNKFMDIDPNGEIAALVKANLPLTAAGTL